MILLPARTARNHLHPFGKAFQEVTVGSLRRRELNGHVSRSEGLALEVFLVINIDNTHNFVATLTGYLLYHLAHLAVANQSYFHN